MNVAIITAAGKGTRLKSNISKQFIKIYGKPILAHTINAFQNSSRISEIYITISNSYLDYCKKEIIEKYSFSKVKNLIIGGNSRQQSVHNALLAINSPCKTVSIHDAVRPLITAKEINLIINTLRKENKSDPRVKGVIMAAPVYETVKKIDGINTINATIPRRKVWFAQTPQTFFYDIILNAHSKAVEDNFLGTDDSSLVERAGWKIKVVKGRHENIKITTPIDLFLAELMMSRK